MTTPRIGIVDGCRTPFTKAGGPLASLGVLDLAVEAVRGLAERTGAGPDQVGSLVLGSALAYPSTPYLARETAIALGWDRVNAYSAESACATSARTLVNAAYELISGEADVAIAGGAESMSGIPVQVTPAVRAAVLAAPRQSPADTLAALLALELGDLLPSPPGVTEPYSGKTLGEHAEAMVADWGIARADADAFAVASHHKAAQAVDAGLLPAQTVPVTTPDGTVKQDGLIRPDTSREAVAGLRPAFARDGTITAANASPLTDGAAAVLLATEDACERNGWNPQAWLRSWAFTSHSPDVTAPGGRRPGAGVLLGPAFALPLALDRAGLTLADIDLFDVHEAFAGQVLANLAAMASDAFASAHLGRSRALGTIPSDRLNVHGGSVAIGHPFGATGARIVTQLVREMARRDVRYGALAICAGGTRGAAMVLEREG